MVYNVKVFFTVCQMYTYDVSLFLYKNLHNVVPDVLFKFQMNTDVYSHLTRQNFKLQAAYTVQHVPGRALSAIKAHKSGITSHKI